MLFMINFIANICIGHSETVSHPVSEAHHGPQTSEIVILVHGNKVAYREMKKRVRVFPSFISLIYII